MKHFYLLVAMLSLSACAGNPPEWWNPSGTYGTQSVNKSNTALAPVRTVTRQAEVEIPAEETIETTVEEYEEMSLNPLEQTETSSAEESSEQADPMYAPAEEHTAREGALPPPSVLE